MTPIIAELGEHGVRLAKAPLEQAVPIGRPSPWRQIHFMYSAGQSVVVSPVVVGGGAVVVVPPSVAAPGRA